ncbi:CPBP family intramembrane glutamic endopeptidase [Maribellus sediminis]|uniref:CPBP family intramembrane glutamic endopeptidase n=1 Tax=Maribellus sediminis TaxID=2696285 RepID=UPI00142F9502|nr:CPBP family intramembrane glutamic endopeptidase [Maribellus sediminis]
MKTGTRKIVYAAEFILLFFGIPLLLFFDSNIVHPSAVLLPVLVGLTLYFLKQKEFRIRDLIRLNISKKMWITQGFIVLGIGILLTIFVWIFEPGNLFNLPRGNWKIWIAMFFFYPTFSAYAQEVVFRQFLFMRYKPLFKTTTAMVLASAVSFSFAHIVYFSVLSLVLTFFAGIYLALVYQKTKSVLFVSILHGALGFFIFTVGLGQHFWLDMMKWIQ